MHGALDREISFLEQLPASMDEMDRIYLKTAQARLNELVMTVETLSGIKQRGGFLFAA